MTCYFQKSLLIGGLQGAVQRTIPTDDRLRLRADLLAHQIVEDRAAGLEPWIVCASAGTVNTGAVDPLSEIAGICKQEQLWFHVDGAYGGLFSLCDKGKTRLSGLDMADSLVLDPHKALFQRYGCGAVLVRDGEKLAESMSYTADYLADVTSSHPSPADYSPELTRHFRSLGLWITFKVHGLQRLRACLTEKLLLAEYAFNGLKEIPNLELGPFPQLSTVTFRVRSEDDQPTQELLEKLLHSGRIHLSSTRFAGRYWLRMCILSFRSHREQVDDALASIGRAV